MIQKTASSCAASLYLEAICYIIKSIMYSKKIYIALCAMSSVLPPDAWHISLLRYKHSKHSHIVSIFAHTAAFASTMIILSNRSKMAKNDRFFDFVGNMDKNIYYKCDFMRF